MRLAFLSLAACSLLAACSANVAPSHEIQAAAVEEAQTFTTAKAAYDQIAGPDGGALYAGIPAVLHHRPVDQAADESGHAANAGAWTESRRAQCGCFVPHQPSAGRSALTSMR